MPDIETIERQRMDELTAGLPSKSAKMRRLAEAGYERADIARYLGVRYQFVYNVLSAPRPTNDRGEASPHETLADTGSTENEQGSRSLAPAAVKWVWVEVEMGGHVALPATFLEAVGVQEGDQVQLALEGDSIRILTRSRALRELRAKVQQFVPEGVSLVDELIAERQAEVVKDPMNG